MAVRWVFNAGNALALVTWVTIFPLITLVVVATAPLLGPLPLVARLAVTTGVTVPLTHKTREDRHV